MTPFLLSSLCLMVSPVRRFEGGPIDTGPPECVGAENRQRQPDQREAQPASGRHRLVADDHAPCQLHCRCQVEEQTHRDHWQPLRGGGEKQQWQRRQHARQNHQHNMAGSLAGERAVTGDLHRNDECKGKRRRDRRLYADADPRIDRYTFLTTPYRPNDRAKPSPMTGGAPTSTVRITTPVTAIASAPNCARLSRSRKISSPSATVTSGLMK